MADGIYGDTRHNNGNTRYNNSDNNDDNSYNGCNNTERLAALYKQYREAFSGEQIVLGAGSCENGIVLIGEAPGRDEVALLKPFVGMAGKQLEEFLGILELRREDIYITNAIKYRLTKISEKTGRVSNRPARNEEVLGNRPYLMREIDILRPSWIVTLGNVPLKAVTGNMGAVIGNVHGEPGAAEVLENSYRLFPLYHPASIIYNRSLKDIYINDIKKLKSLLL